MSTEPAELLPRIEAKRRAALEHNDAGNAERLVTDHGDEIRYVPGLRWHVWDGRRWRPDDDGAVMRKAKATVRTMRQEAAAMDDVDAARSLFKWATTSGSQPRLRAMVESAESEEPLIARADDLDSDPYLLNVLNGTIDLRTGDLHPHERGDLITKLAPVEYDPDANDPRWDSFLSEATGDDDELATFLQRSAGYTLTGDTGEEVLLFPHGPGATGKSTFLEALKGSLGDYATTADFETFLARRDASGPRSGIAQLAGARFVVSIEVEDGKRLAESIVKTLTGGDTVRASFLYKDSFEFTPRFTLWLAANHAPQVSAQDDAMWRRILRIPFEHQVPPERRDPTLKAHLRRPNPAVLAWAVRGCLAWQRDGLGIPPAVRRSTANYREEMDPIGEFLDEHCAFDPASEEPAEEIWKAYQRWAEDMGIRHPPTRRALTARLKDSGATVTRTRTRGVQVRIWKGVGLRGVTR